MAIIHFLKDGKLPNGDRLTLSVNVSWDDAVRKLGGFESKYTKCPPTINPCVKASNWSDYKYVVFEVENGEGEPPFKKSGYYYLIGVSPSECQRLLDIRVETI